MPLSAAGRKRAVRLASMLRDAGVRQIFTSDMTRTRETAAPLASRTGVTAEAIAAVDALVARLRSLPGGSVSLVVHHSNTVPAIVEKLGGPRMAAIDEEEFDRLVVLSRLASGKVQVLTLRY